MTPTRLGRWQTRILLFIIAGLPVTLIFGWLIEDYITPLAVLGYVLVIGFVWDLLYYQLQLTRWDQDWPPSFQLLAGIVEAVFLWLLISFSGLFAWESLPGINPHLTLSIFLAHYWLVWVGVFLGTQGPLRILFPRWRFNGGQWM